MAYIQKEEEGEKATEMSFTENFSSLNAARRYSGTLRNSDVMEDFLLKMSSGSIYTYSFS